MTQLPILFRVFASSRLRVFALACALPLASWGQQIVSGTVTDEDNIQLPGAAVVVQNTTRGTTTDFDGKYQIQANEGDTLIFTYVGYTTQLVTVGSSTTINVQMQISGQLEEVVVTALGIKRDKKALGYAVTSLKSENIESRPQADIARILNGKISGVNVIGTGGIAGSGTNITIRDNVSITGNNQPLFVVNGIPFNSETNNESNVTTGNGSVSASSRFLDIDPNSITDVSILKGLSATVLYGNAGRNGVILITTKTGTTSVQKSDKGFEIDLNQSSFYNEISSLPDYQNTYGQGGDNSINVGFVGNWGGRFDQNTSVRHHYNIDRLSEVFPEFQGVQVPYRSFKNNVKDFFRTGFGRTTSLNISKANENVSFNINYGNTDEDGYVPGNNFKRDNFGIGGSSKLSNKITINGSFNFTSSRFTTPPIAADNGVGNFSIFTRTLFVPRNLDLNLPHQNPFDGSSVYYRTDQENPNWLLDNSQESINVNRFFNSINTSVQISEKINFIYRLGLDIFNEKQQFYINKGGVSALIAQQGYLRTTHLTNTNWDHSFIATAESLNISDDLSVNATIGVNAFSERQEKFGIVSTGQVSFGLIDHNNFSTQSNSDPLGTSLDFIVKENTLGLYGQLEIDYSDYLFITLSGRNDWSSTIEEENRVLFYPGTSISWIPTTQFENLRSDLMNYLKLRLSYATSAGFPGNYLTRATLPQGTAVFTTNDGRVINTNSSSFIFPNPDLKAELHTEIEAGIETRLWNNKIGLEVSVYQRSSQDQILQKTLDTSTGYSTTFINAGEIETRGIEIDLNVSPFNYDSPFQWNSNIAFTSTQNKVVDLPQNDEIFISGFSNQGNYAIEGKPLGVIRGSYALKDDEGNLLINPSTGNIIDSDAVGLDDEIIGDPNPDWRVTNINSISYKGLTLSAQLEYVHGGDFSSNTINNLLRRGVTKDTEDRESTFVIEGFYADPDTGTVLLDADGNKIPNTIQLGTNEVYFLNFIDPSGQQIYDGSVIRLREISLAYNFPKKVLKNTPIGSLSISFFGNNLWFNAPNVPEHTNFDPEVISTGVGNGRGLEFQTAPTSKKYGMNIRATF